MLKGTSIDNHINPLLEILGLNIHKDTPTEILHTLLLSVVKYYWGQMAFILDKYHLLATFQVHLDSVVKDGFGDVTLGADYMVQYKGSIIGGHFKSLAQIMPYLIYDLIPHTLLGGLLYLSGTQKVRTQRHIWFVLTISCCIGHGHH